MSDKHPYISGSGPIVKAIDYFRNSLPATIDAATIKKLGLARNNESYLISILKFIGIVGEDGATTVAARKVFSMHDNAAFKKSFAELVKTAYSDLFSLHGEKSWDLDNDALITYFRQTDQSSSVVGTRQASAFATLASIAGHGETPTARSRTTTAQPKAEKSIARSRQPKNVLVVPNVNTTDSDSKTRALGLSVRIEINLPVADNQATYDRIFKSIKENLLDT